jgi:hypothetical protein
MRNPKIGEADRAEGACAHEAAISLPVVVLQNGLLRNNVMSERHVVTRSRFPGPC